MEITTLRPRNIDRRMIERAADIMRAGQLIIYPTDTHPAIGADALNAQGIARLCELKKVNPEKHTLTLVCDSIHTASRFARIDNRVFAIMRDNTPGPVTFILPTAPSLPKAYRGRKEVGIRIPDNDIARALVSELGNPIVSGSLGEPDAAEVESKVELMIVDADAEYAVETESSAIINLTDSANPVVVRESSRLSDL